MDIKQNQIPHIISIIKFFFFYNLSYQKITKKSLKGHFPHIIQKKETTYIRDKKCIIETREKLNGEEIGYKKENPR